MPIAVVVTLKEPRRVWAVKRGGVGRKRGRVILKLLHQPKIAVTKNISSAIFLDYRGIFKILVKEVSNKPD